MPHRGHVRFALGTLLSIKLHDRRVVESCGVGSKPDGAAKVRGATLGHFAASPREVTGLLDGGIDARKGGKLGGGFKTGNVTDLTKDNGGQYRTHAGDRSQLGIELGVEARKLLLDARNGLLKRLDLFQILPDQQAEGIAGKQDAKGITRNVLNLNRFVVAEATATGKRDQIAKLGGVHGDDFFGCGVFRKELHGGHAKGIREQFFVFGEYLIKQRNDLAFEIRDHVHDEESMTAKFPKRMDIRRRNSGFGVASKADNLGDDEGILGIVLSLPDIKIPQRVGLYGIDHMDGEARVTQMPVQRQPVMAGSFQADLHQRQIGNMGFEEIHEALKAGEAVGKAEGFAEDVPALID